MHGSLAARLSVRDPDGPVDKVLVLVARREEAEIEVGVVEEILCAGVVAANLLDAGRRRVRVHVPRADSVLARDGERRARWVLRGDHEHLLLRRQLDLVDLQLFGRRRRGAVIAGLIKSDEPATALRMLEWTGYLRLTRHGNALSDGVSPVRQPAKLLFGVS